MLDPACDAPREPGLARKVFLAPIVPASKSANGTAEAPAIHLRMVPRASSPSIDHAR
jgi:hypothetical protein